MIIPAVLITGIHLALPGGCCCASDRVRLRHAERIIWRAAAQSVDILDIGRAILDSPIVDIKFDA
jgi:hypothetical protein